MSLLTELIAYQIAVAIKMPLLRSYNRVCYGRAIKVWHLSSRCRSALPDNPLATIDSNTNYGT